MRRLLFTVLAAAILAVSSFAGASTVAAAASGAKVVIVVGATGSTTASYIHDAEDAAATAAKYTTNIVKVYSPNATWANVAAAAQGANVLVYLGHGSGWPNPYAPGYHLPSGDNGMGLNVSAGGGDANTKYYGEDYMAQLGLAPNSLVLLWHLCYASGNNEWGRGLPDLATATLRVDGYASGFTRAGAGAVIAEGVGDISPYIDSVFGQGTQTIDSVWKHAPNFHNHVQGWASSHVDADAHDDYAALPRTSQIDPDLNHPAADGDYYYRSMVASPALTGSQITGSRVGPSAERWDGPTRYEVAAKVSANTFTAGKVPVAFVATGENFPDALAGASAAAKMGGPVLLVTSTTIPSAIAAELIRLKPTKIYVLGGVNSVSDSVVQQLPPYTTAGVERIGGATRYDAAANISLLAFGAAAPVPVAFVATGEKFPDALAGAAAASKLGGPVLLVTSTSIPPATADALTRLKPARIVVVGGPVSVSADVEAALHQFTGGPVDRWADADRYSAAAAISRGAYPDAETPVKTVFVATGLNFPDALSGAAVATRWGGPVLLVPGTYVPDSVVAELTRLKPQRIVILGGINSVSPAVQVQLGAYIAAPAG